MKESLFDYHPDSKEIIEKYQDKLQISYFYKPNSGPGDSRNFGMKQAKGNYFIILDSDCIIPKEYLKKVEKTLSDHYVDSRSLVAPIIFSLLHYTVILN